MTTVLFCRRIRFVVVVRRSAEPNRPETPRLLINRTAFYQTVFAPGKPLCFSSFSRPRHPHRSFLFDKRTALITSNNNVRGRRRESETRLVPGVTTTVCTRFRAAPVARGVQSRANLTARDDVGSRGFAVEPARLCDGRPPAATD